MSLRTKWRPGDRFLVRYKDDALFVVEKKAGLLTVARESGRGADLIKLLAEFAAAGSKRRAHLIPVHRLDRPVSGLLVVARTKDAADALIAQFAEHSVERRYVACVEGSLAADEGTFESYLGETGDALRMASTTEDQGRLAITHWRVVERLPSSTLVEIELETGLRNQIRVHFAEAGHPLLGERKYLPKDDPRARDDQGVERLFLHAARLGFEHPWTGRRMRFEAPLPPDLLGWKKKLSRERKPNLSRRDDT